MYGGRSVTSLFQRFHTRPKRLQISIDTVTVTLSHFILAMVQYPDVLARAQAELDAVLGLPERLPTFEDRASLPYCDAVFIETLRWSVAAPLGK